MDFRTAINLISGALQGTPTRWEGKKAVLEMKAADFAHWRQMEWIGFYFQYQCATRLSGIVEMPGPRYGRAEFDGLLAVPWDFKAHAMNTSSHQVIVNDSLAVSTGIAEYGSVGLILAVGAVEYNDEQRSFQRWHNALKGGPSAYEIERVQRGAWSRLRKVSFDLRQISFIRVTDRTLVRSGSFQSDFRNSNGRPRKAKVLLDLEKLDDELVGLLEF